MTGQRQASDLRKAIAIESQDIQVAINEVPHVEKATVRAERDAFGETTHFCLTDPRVPCFPRSSAATRTNARAGRMRFLA